MSPASPRRSFTPTIRRVPGNFEVARFLAAMAPRLVGRAATSSAGRSGCAVVIGAAQPTDQSSVAASIARAADRGFVAVLSRHRYRCESPHHRPTPRRHDERGLPASRWFCALRRHARLAPSGGGTARLGISGASAVDLHTQLRCRQLADKRPQPEEHGTLRRQARQLSISEAGRRRIALERGTDSSNER